MEKPTADYYIDDKSVFPLPYVRPAIEPEQLVICLSGGLDSTVAYYHALEKGYKNIKCLFFNIGQKYVEKERKALDELGIPYEEINLPFYAHIAGNTTEKDYIIKNRNSVFANVAAVYGNRIWIVGLSYENHYLMHDKNDAFYRYTSLALTQSTGRETIVETPFADMDKKHLFQLARRYGKLKEIDKTVSCYHPTEKRCGKCSLCFKRWIAGQVAMVSETFTVDPRFSVEGLELTNKYRKALKEMDFSHYSQERIRETLKIIDHED